MKVFLLYYKYMSIQPVLRAFFSICQKTDFVRRLADSARRNLEGVYSHLKTKLIRLLLRRSGFFAQPSRLGLTSLLTSTVFGLVLMPSLAAWQNQQNINYVLAGEPSSPATLDTLIEASSPQTQTMEGRPREEVTEYTIAAGDTLWSIGQRFSVGIEALAFVNDLSNEDLLTVGQKINIPPVDGVVHTVKKGETVSSIAGRYTVDAQTIVDFNYLDAPYLLAIGQQLVVPDAKIPAKSPLSRGGLELQTVINVSGKLAMPTQGTITQYFSWYHPAIDIANAAAPQVRAADGGTVYFAGWWPGGGGNTVMINHGNGLITKYAHLSSVSVGAGETVGKGQAIGQMGATGRAYGTHLHFIVEQNGKAVNPLSIL